MLIAASRIITAAGRKHGTPAVLRPGYLRCENGRITAVRAGKPDSQPDVELRDGVLLPGFIDLQVNGYFGVEFAAADRNGWALVARRLPESGTTAFLPTFITAPLAEMADALRRAHDCVSALPERKAGARVLGFHVEGPFIAASRRGAHNAGWIVPPDTAAVETLLAAGQGLVRVMTLAPEVDGAMAAIRQLDRAGVIASVGHSDATGRQVAAAATSGARMITHLFNAQRPMHHREPGVVGQALSDSRFVASLIADLHHVSGQVAAIAFAAAPGRICLVTDAAACAGRVAGTPRGSAGS